MSLFRSAAVSQTPRNQSSMSTNNNLHQSTTSTLSGNYFVGFKVCVKKRDQNNYISIEVWRYDTLNQLKEKAAYCLHITEPLNKFFLEIYTENMAKWVAINNANPSATIKELKLQPGSMLSIEYYDSPLTDDERTLYPTSSNNISDTLLVDLKVCRAKRNQGDYELIIVQPSNTLKQLKEKIVFYMNIGSKADDFVLEVFNKEKSTWDTIDDTSPFATIKQLKLRTGSILNIKHWDPPLTKDNRPLYSTSSSSTSGELVLKLCKEPMNTKDYDVLYLRFSSTVGELRKQAYKQLRKVPKNHPIYLRNKGQWEQFGSSMDDLTIADLPFENDAFISLDYDDEESTSKVPPGLCGLANLGSTCYMNSVFQCLSNIPEFKKRILALNAEVNAPIIGEYAKLIKRIWSEKYKTIEPDALLENINHSLPNYGNYRQQDAQEFMNHFLHLIHAELSTKDTIITELFYGQIQSTVKCLQCQQVEKTNESISFLPLPISNYNQKNVLYIKTDGEQRQVSILVDSTVSYVGDLINCFLSQHEPKMKKERIHAFQLVNNRYETEHDTWSSLRFIREEELAFLEYPEKSFDQKHIRCDFYDYSTRNRFRPAVYLVCPNAGCRFSDICEQIDQLLGHLCSATETPASACHLYWIDYYDKRHELSIESEIEKNLTGLRSILIEMPPESVQMYGILHNTNNSTKNSGLTSLLADFFHEEPLDGDYHCLKCPKRTKARQKSDLCLPLPQTLVIQLKRFTYEIYSNDKIDTYISFPLNDLDLNEYIVKDNSNKKWKQRLDKIQFSCCIQPYR